MLFLLLVGSPRLIFEYPPRRLLLLVWLPVGCLKEACCVVSVACGVSQIDFLIPSSSVVASRLAACGVFNRNNTATLSNTTQATGKRRRERDRALYYEEAGW